MTPARTFQLRAAGVLAIALTLLPAVGRGQRVFPGAAPRDTYGTRVFVFDAEAGVMRREELGAIAARATPGTLILSHALSFGGPMDEIVAGVRRGGFKGTLVAAKDLDRF